MRGTFGIVVALATMTSCAQAPTKELELTTERVDAARKAEAAIYASEPFARAEEALSAAKAEVGGSSSYAAAIARMTDAVRAANVARQEAVMHRRVVARHVDRCLKELDGLIAIVRSRGGERHAPEELAAYVERYRQVLAIAESGDLLGALDTGTRLRPELLAFERRFRPATTSAQ